MRQLVTVSCVLLFYSSGFVQEDSSQPRPFVEIAEQVVKPTVKAIAPIDDTNVFFLNKRGQAGVAKFSPGLSLIGWELYSKVKLNSLNSLGVGPNYSLVTASPVEVTQAFDTTRDGSLDFFQGLVRDWQGRDKGVQITAGPVADSSGRLLFALSPFSIEEGQPPLARLVAWHPDSEGLQTLTESQLQISSFSVGPDRILAARLSMPAYSDGYYISLTELPPFLADNPDVVPDPLPKTLPSLLIPAELTGGKEPTQMCFFVENNQSKLILTCPDSNQLIEIVPEKSGSQWQGAILLRSRTPSSIESVVEMNSGLLLGGGPDGFFPLETPVEAFRIKSVKIAEDGIVLEFSEEVSRFHGVKSDSYTLKSVSLRGNNKILEAEPVIESDGKTIILKTDEIGKGVVLRVVCQNLPSADGDPLFHETVFYTIHEG